jgi:tetratricopeptide (TPR) repeat protein
VNNQHDAPDLPFTWWTTTFKNNIRSIGQVVLVLAPWRRPVALTRAWCLWELYCAASQTDNGVTLELRLPASQRPDFVRALINDFEAMADALAVMDAATAQATNESDREKILAAVTAETSTAALNTTVKDELRAWCHDAGLAALAELEGQLQRQQQQQQQQEDFGGQAHPAGNALRLTAAAEARGSSPATPTGVDVDNILPLQIADLCASLGRLLRRDYGENVAALTMHERALTLRHQHLGPAHAETVSARYDVAMVRYAQGAYAQALSEMTEVARMQQTDGVRRATTLNSMAAAQRSLGNVAAAVALHTEALDLQKDQLGSRTPEVAATLNSFAASMLRLGHRTKALELLDEALEIRIALHGPRHAEVGVINNNRARLLEEQGDLDAAAAVHASVLDIRREALGPSHHKVASTMNNLATVEIRRGELQRAADLLRTALRLRQEQLGPDHPKVAASYAQLAMVASLAGDAAAAVCLNHVALTKRCAALGDWHKDIACNFEQLGDAFAGLGVAHAAVAAYITAGAIIALEGLGQNTSGGNGDGSDAVDREGGGAEDVAWGLQAWDAVPAIPDLPNELRRKLDVSVEQHIRPASCQLLL